MAASPKFKVYDRGGEYQAAAKSIETAAVLVAWYGDGATIRLDHRQVLWTEGAEALPASESYDYVAETAGERMDAIHWRYRRASHTTAIAEGRR